MASQENSQLHFVLMPLMSPGHLIPMIDMARLLALRSVFVSVVTTPSAAVKFTSTIERARDCGLKIQLLQLPFPAAEAGVPDGCESMEKLTSRSYIRNFYNAVGMLQQPFEKLLETLRPRPSCIISGKNVPWTVDTARKFGIPRIFSDGMGCFSFSCSYKLETSKAHLGVSGFETFVVPDLPHRIELTSAKLPENLNPGSPDLADVRDRIKAVEAMADGIIVNSFEELETEYVNIYKEAKGSNIWCIGPVAASNKEDSDKAERGGHGSIEINRCLTWLDAHEPGSVIYACLGSICGLATWQLVEIGLGLEASNQSSFIWVVRDCHKTEGFEKWIKEEGFEERTKKRGLVIRGWAPQALILSHEAIGGFLTHCGWNSTIEGITSGVPLITCPLFAEQFCNEKLIVEVMKVGVSVGVERAIIWGLEEKFGLVVKREQVEKAIAEVMKKGKESEERRKRARELGVVARNAIEEGGSSYINMESLIQFVKDVTNKFQ